MFAELGDNREKKVRDYALNHGHLDIAAFQAPNVIDIGADALELAQGRSRVLCEELAG
jgi:hypothetical protein